MPTSWQQSFWSAVSGEVVEDLMRSGAVTLLDAEWLVAYAAAGLVLRPRQQLPYEAYVSVNDLLSAQVDGEHLRVALVSHPVRELHCLATQLQLA
jgi:hypothetical protein